MIQSPDRQFWIEVIAALKLLISAIERHKLGKGKPAEVMRTDEEWERRNNPAA
jgi:hypothetical protein